MSVTQKLASGTWRRYSADDGGYYYHNEETDQSVWDPPPGWSDPEPAQASPSSAAVPLDTLGEGSVSRSGSTAVRGPRPSEVRTSQLAGTDMHPAEVASMRAQAGPTTGSSSPGEPEQKRQKPKPDILRSSSGQSKPCCKCDCLSNISFGTCLICFLISLGIITAVVLAVVLTLPQTVSCDSGDEGYFVKEISSPVIYSISENSFCTSAQPYNITVTGKSFLKYNDDKPKIMIGSWAIPATYLMECSDVDVRKQDVSECNELTVTIPVDDGSHGGGAVTFAVVNKQPSSPHPAAKVTTSTTCNTVDYSIQVLAVPAPRVDSFSPGAICSVLTSTFTLTGDYFLQLRADNTSAWQKPWITFTGAGEDGMITPDQVTLSDCYDLDIGPMGIADGYHYGQICTTLMANTQSNTMSGVTAILVNNPGPNQCQQLGNTTFFAAPATSVSGAEPSSICWSAQANTINLTGTFVAEIGSSGIIPPTVLLDGQPVNSVTPVECIDYNTNSGHNWQVCNKLTVTFTPSAVIPTNTSYFPSFSISNPNLNACGGTFKPLAYVAPPTLSPYPTILPVICSPGTFASIRLGGTFLQGDTTLTFGFGGANGGGVKPVQNPNLFDCYNPDTGSSVTLCRGVDLTVPSTAITGTDRASVQNSCSGGNAALFPFDIVQVPAASTILANPPAVACVLPFNFTVASGAVPFYRVGGVFYNAFIVGSQSIGSPDIYEDPAIPCTPGSPYDTCTSLIVVVRQRIAFNTGINNNLRVTTGTCTSTNPNTIFINGPCITA